MVQVAEQPQLKLRWMEAEDKAFVASTWLRSYQSQWGLSSARIAQHASLIVDRLIRSSLRGIAQAVPSAAPAIILVQCSPEKEKILHGFVCGVPGEFLHYVYVPEKLRGHGYARRMVRTIMKGYPDQIRSSHRSIVKRCVFDPTLLSTVRG